MQVTVSSIGTLRSQVTIAYTAAEVQARRQQILKQLSGEVKLNGFRPGKTSVSVLEKRYGAAATAHTEERLGDDGFSAAIKEHNLRPIGPVANDGISRDGGALSFTVSFDVKPAITIPAASTFTIAPQATEVTDAEVDEQVSGLARRAGNLSDLAEGETVVEDDSITVAGSVQVDGAEVRALHDFNHLVGGYPFFGKPAADVVAAVSGKKVGDQVSFETTLPDSFSPKEQAGKAAVVSFTIQAAKRLRAATIDDEFAKRVGVDNLEALKGLLRARLSAGKEQSARTKQAAELVEKLLAAVEVQLPPKLLESTIADGVAAVVRDAESKKTPVTDLDAAKREAEEEAVKGLKRFLVLDALADQLKVEVTNDDFRDQISMAAQQTGRNPDEIAKQLRDSGRANQVAMEIREAKAIETLLDQILTPAQAAAAV